MHAYQVVYMKLKEHGKDIYARLSMIEHFIMIIRRTWLIASIESEHWISIMMTNFSVSCGGLGLSSIIAEVGRLCICLAEGGL